MTNCSQFYITPAAEAAGKSEEIASFCPPLYVPHALSQKMLAAPAFFSFYVLNPKGERIPFACCLKLSDAETEYAVFQKLNS